MKKINFILFLLSAVLCAQAAPTFVDYGNNGGVRLADKDYPAVISFDANDFPGVKIAIESLQKDFEAVTGIQAQTHADGHIVIGTLGKSKAIDRFVKRGINSPTSKVNTRSLSSRLLMINLLLPGATSVAPFMASMNSPVR